ncbi:MAG: hypothetical protein ACKO23_09370 [Gemmataceae bacterium]
MLARLGLRFVAIGLLLMVIGWIAIGHFVFEIVRVFSITFLTVGMVLLIADYVVTPLPPGK